MNARELDALKALTFNWTRSEEDVWAASPYHVEGLHSDVAEQIRRGIDVARAGNGSNPLGIAIQGQRGVGKTHLIGWARQYVQQAGGYFFLVGILSGSVFWDEVLVSLRDGLNHRQDDGTSQLERLLGDLAAKAGVGPAVRAAVTGQGPLLRADLDAFIGALRTTYREIGMTCQDTARALVLLASPHQDQQDVGHYYLSGYDLETDERRAWGIRSTRKVPQLFLSEISQLLALSGPTVIAVDQIDALIEEIQKSDDARLPDKELLITRVAGGLMAIRDRTRRALTIVSCLPTSWSYISQNTIDTVTDRFRRALQLQNIPSPDIGRTVVEKRFTVDYATVGFVPPYPSWPVRPEAFADAPAFTVRRLLRRIEEHVSQCVRTGVVHELDDFGEKAGGVRGSAPPEPYTDQDLAGLDARFDQLRRAAEVSQAFDHRKEDAVLPALLTAGLEAWIRERGDQAGGELPFVAEPPTGRSPALHACLKQTVDERTERKRLWGFRAIGSDHAKAVLSRLRPAVASLGLDGRTSDRQLFVLRNQPWPSGPKTERETAAFAAAGGVVLPYTADDLKTFAALARLLAERDPHLDGWLRVRRPAGSTGLLGAALGDATPEPAAAAADGQPRRPKHRKSVDERPVIRIGTATPGGMPVGLELESLRKHAVVFAGSGSGKTVLLRRIVEECALQGVSAIVLDPNNDLARLGDGWPEAPAGWFAGDAERARDYLDSTEVVVWTPRRDNGRPLAFQPLPAFADLRDDPDAFQVAVDVAVHALAPRIHADRTTSKAQLEKAVLTQALGYFGQVGRGGLPGFVELLRQLPDRASALPDAHATAADLAKRLEVAQVNDRLFGGSGTSADPALLLTPASGKRARISVISMVGLPSEEQRQSFVNQLQMALFSWIKRHPAGDRPLGGLFVMDEAQTLAPSSARTASTHSTLMLASQARKYGLGLVFATQAPKGLHNQIPGNATTQFFGLLNHPAQIEAARTLARAKGGDVPNISRLSRGQFYLATEGCGFRRTQVPMCLSHHPPSPLTEEEVIARARA